MIREINYRSLIVILCIYISACAKHINSLILVNSNSLQNKNRRCSYSIQQNLDLNMRVSAFSQLNYKRKSLFNAVKGMYVSTKSDMDNRWKVGVKDFKARPWTYITIPIVAGLVGYVTNWLGVKMLFYPIDWVGLPLMKWPGQPLGIIGWQGIVPCKRLPMTNKMVDVTISQLLKISEIFSVLSPSIMAENIAPSVRKVIYGGFVPSPILNFFLRRTSKDVIKNIENIVDIKSIVVKGMCTDPTILGSFFQKVANKELIFLVDSGLSFGFLLGIGQMFQWMLFPSKWSLPIGGALVGYITNWIALKMIFEPLNPVSVGPFVFQGLFLKRQKEVAAEFCNFISTNVLTSFQIWQTMLNGPKADLFMSIIKDNVPFPGVSIPKIIDSLKNTVGLNAGHSLHKYTDYQLKLKEILVSKMNKMSPAQFEQILHPIFQEDEITLILAGGVLGFFAGLLQMWGNDAIDNYLSKKRSKEEIQRQLLSITPPVDDQLQLQPQPQPQPQLLPVTESFVLNNLNVTEESNPPPDLKSIN